MSQIFKSNIEPHILFDLLEKICIKTDNKYVLDKASYKKAGSKNYRKIYSRYNTILSYIKKILCYKKTKL